MLISLGTRTEANVAIYFEKAQDEAIWRTLPQKAKTLEEAISDFHASQAPGSTSFGRTVLADGRYVGDVWCYDIDRNSDPQAMVSYCVFEKDCWNRGVATEALRLFLEDVTSRFALRVFGAFTYASNAASRHVLEKNGFTMMECFVEDGVESCYYQMIARGSDHA